VVHQVRVPGEPPAKVVNVINGQDPIRCQPRRGSRGGAVEQGQLGCDVAQVEVPSADTGFGPPVPQGPVGNSRLAGTAVDEDRLPGGAFLVAAEISGAEELSWDVRAVPRFERDQERQSGVALDVVDEGRHPPLHEVHAEDDVPHRHRHRQRAVGAGLGR
jgi:hypothetical protein